MIKIEKINVSGFEAALRGMRNPMNSWNKSDSLGAMTNRDNTYFNYTTVGKEDLKLAKRLCKAGPCERKFLRMIHVSMDITAPLYWWKEFDTYKVGTVANSCSTMHKIHDKEFSIEDFSNEHLSIFCDDSLTTIDDIINTLNIFRKQYIETKDKKYWWGMIQLLPSSYNQKRTIDVNYETLFNIYKWRKSHKLDEWVKLCKYIYDNLPYFKELIEGGNINE